jgi:hypothetical protein
MEANLGRCGCCTLVLHSLGGSNRDRFGFQDVLVLSKQVVYLAIATSSRSLLAIFSGVTLDANSWRGGCWGRSLTGGGFGRPVDHGRHTRCGHASGRHEVRAVGTGGSGNAKGRRGVADLFDGMTPYPSYPHTAQAHPVHRAFPVAKRRPPLGLSKICIQEPEVCTTLVAL